MKPKYRSFQSLSVSFIAFSLAGLSTDTANAANRVWSGATSSLWSTSGNWNTLPIATDTATFNSAGNGRTTIDLGVSGATIQILTFDTASAAAYTIGAGAVGSQTLTLGNAGLLSVTSTVTKNQLINANLTLGNATASTYSLTNSSLSNSLTVAGAIQGGGAGAKTLTLDGVGTMNVSGAISNGLSTSLAVVANSGLLTLSGANTYTGGTTISGNTLQVSNFGNQGSTTSNLGTGSLKFGTSTSTGTLKYTGSGETANRTIDLAGTTFGGTLDASGSGLFKLTSDFTATGAGDKTLTLTGSGAGEIAGKIVDNSGSNTTAVTKSGNNTWTLSGANTYTGLTTVSAGTLAYGISNAIASGAVQVSGGTLDISTYSDTVGAITLTGGSISGSTGVLTGTSYAMQNGSVSAILAGSAALTKTTSGTVTLSNSNTYTGITTISAGVLSVSSLANGSLASNIGQSTNAAVNLVLGGGTLQYTGSSVSTDRNFTLSAASNSSVDVSNAGTNLTLSGASTNTTGGLIKIGAGKLTLSGANLYTGLTDVQAGTLAYGANNTISSGAVQVSGGTLDISSYSDTVGAVTLTSGSITGTTGVLTGASYALDGTVDTSVSAILGGTGALTKSGAGIATLSGANTFTGATTITAGTLRLGKANALGTTAGITTVTTGTLDLNGQTVGAEAISVGGTGLLVNDNTGTAASLSGNVTFANAATVGGAGDLTLSGVIQTGGNQNFFKTGAGTLTLTGTNLFTRALTVSAGVVNVQNSSGLGSTSANIVTVSSGAALELQGGITVGAKALTLNGTGIASDGALRNISGNNTYSALLTLGAATRINSDAGNLSISNVGTITGATFGLTVGGAGNTTIASIIGTTTGTLTKDGTGTLTLSGANTFTGNTTITGGTLAYGVANALSSGNVTVNGGTLNMATFADTVGAVTLTSGSITGTSGVLSGTSYTLNNTANTTISAILGGGAGNLSQSGTGTTVLSGNNTYTGNTTITAGVLNIQNNTALGVVGNGTTVASGAALQIQGGITVGAEALSLRGTGVSSDGALRNISGANTYGGAVTLAAASQINSDAGTLTLTGGVTGTFGLTVGGAGNTTFSTAAIGTSTAGLTKNDAGTLRLSFANTFTGNTTINGGTLAYGVANALSSGNVTVNGGTLNMATFADTVGAVTLTSGSITGTSGVLSGTSYTLNNTANTTISAILGGGAGNLTQSGTGTTVLSGNNTYTGNTTITAGVLNIQNNTALGVVGNGTTVASGAALQIQGGITVGAEALSLRGTGVASDGALRNISGANTYGGAITLAADSQINSDAGTLTLTGGATGAFGLTVGGAGNTTVSTTALGTGVGGLTKTGAGTLTLSVANTFTGLTSVTGGTLTYGIANALSSGDVTVNGGTLDMATFSDTVGAVTLTSGPITGSGTLTGTSYALQGGNVSANLGTGNVTVTTGNTTLSGTSASTAVAINSGSLILGSSNRLVDGATVTVAGGILDTGVSLTDTVSAFNMSSGSLNGTGTITAATYGLSGGTVTANLGAGSMTVTGNTTLSGTSASTAVVINSGKLTLGSSNRLADVAAVTINGGILDMAGFSDTVASMQLTSGSIIGGTLTSSAAYDAQSGSVSSILAGSVGLNKTSSGTVTLTGANTYTGKTTISGGTLAIGTNGSIANTSEVSLGGGNFNVSAVTSYALGADQSLTGSGLVSGDLTINGTLAIGASPGTINFNNDLTLGLGSVSNFEFTSGSFNALSFDLAQGGLAHTVNFGGTLNLFFKSDETFTSGTSVKIFDFGYYAGNFSAVNVSGMGVGTNATFDSSTGIVTVIPEPRAALLGGLGLLVLLRRRRA